MKELSMEFLRARAIPAFHLGVEMAIRQKKHTKQYKFSKYFKVYAADSKCSKPPSVLIL
jgi:hypothetical protein